MPKMMPPLIWLLAVFSLSRLPMSNAPTQRATRTSPESSCTRTSQNCAPNACMENFFFSSLSGAESAFTSRRGSLARVRIAA